MFLSIVEECFSFHLARLQPLRGRWKWNDFEVEARKEKFITCELRREREGREGWYNSNRRDRKCSTRSPRRKMYMHPPFFSLANRSAYVEVMGSLQLEDGMVVSFLRD